MKPICIEMTAFGSYKEEKIEFDLPGGGIFLITGDTGSGKTTIFDAITYALYGKTSGGIRDGKMMRSQYAKKGVRTQVTFRFLYDGKEYTVTRSPKQPNYRLDKKTGEYKELKNEILENVELTMPDGSLFVGSKDEKEKKISDIIGLDFRQFTQVVMLAQGDFLKLLHSSSQERKEIFARIFDTAIYDKIRKELEDRNRNGEIRLAQNKNDISNELEQIKYAQGSDYEREWEERKTKGLFTDSESETLLELIEKIIKEVNQKIQLAGKEKDNIQGKIIEAEYEIRRAGAVNNQFAKLEKYKEDRIELGEKEQYIREIKVSAKKGEKALLVEKDYTELEKKKKELEECRIILDSLEQWLEENRNELDLAEKKSAKANMEYNNDAPVLHAETDKINKSLLQFEELEKKQKELNEKEEDLKKQKDELKNISENIKSLGKSLTDINAVTKDMEQNMPQIQVLQGKIDILESREEEITDILNNIQKYSEAEKNVLLIKEQLKKCTVESQEAEEDYKNAYEAFVNSQADLLRKQLKDGEPCPVCGSLYHNETVHVSEGRRTLTDSDDLEQFRKRLDQVKERKLEKEKAYEKAKANEENIKNNLNNGCKKILGHDYIDEKSVKDEYGKIKKQLEEHKKDVEQGIKIREAVKKNLLIIKSREKELEESTQKEKKLEKQINNENIAVTELRTGVRELRKNLPYDSRDRAEESLKTKRAKLQELEENRKRFEEAYKKLKEEVDTKQGQYLTEKKNIKTYSQETAEREKTYMSVLKAKGFTDTDDFKSALISEEKIARYREEADEYGVSRLRIDENIKQLEEELKDKQPVNTQEKENRKKELEFEKNRLEKEEKELTVIASVNQSCYEKCRKMYDLRVELKDRQSVITNLYRTASGKDGTIKMDFQTYIQRRYFRRIINSANKRLRQMNNDQFELKCRDMDRLGHQGSVGLDLDICDLTENRDRDVKTLSGGESFVAALAMALGMGDIIQNGNGRIHIDTMFIDEGFGALSEETRNQTIEVLSRLSDGNNLVGIISHVEELKARVETKLVVTKTGSGSHAEWAAE